MRSALPAISCDILVAGGSAGGTAAAIAAAEAGATVCLLSDTDWLGGQLTTQGVCTPDENRWIEPFSATRLYQTFRAGVRNHYRSTYSLSAAGQEQANLNVGSCWVSGLSFEPKVGAAVLAAMAQPHVEAGTLRIYSRMSVVELGQNPETPNEITEVWVRGEDGSSCRFQPKYVLDATDTGDLLPLCGEEGIDWIVGAESQEETGEPDAPPTARPDWVQPFTFPFPVDWSPETAETNVIAVPEDYARLKEQQNYHVIHGAITGIFTGRMPWWTYRRVLAAANFEDDRIPRDLAMINTAGNDYYGGNILGANAGDAAQQAATLARARLASLGYLYWLQTECSREDGTGMGYPELRLRYDIFDTQDGCSVRPYIRESRRIRSLRPILEQEIVVRDFQGNICRGENARAAFMQDTIGIGHYALDIHPNGHGEPNHFVATRPFQIPLGALLPVRLRNLLPACKNLGTTHLTNGAYRLHPIEWNIGESAGRLAAFCVRTDRTPHEVRSDPRMLEAFQKHLLDQGIPLHWYVDAPKEHPAFSAVQTLAGKGIPLGSDADLLFHPEDEITENDWSVWRAAVNAAAPTVFHGSRAEAALFLCEHTAN